MGTQPVYCTREDVKRSLDSKTTARDDAQVDRAIQTGARNVEGLLHRRFYPEQATRSFDWPNQQYARPWRLWLDGNEVISVTSLVSGGITIGAGDYFLRRSDDRDEAPYTHIEIDLGSSAAFTTGPTHQRTIAVTGLWGHRTDETPAGATAEALDASETAVDVTDGSGIGVGTLLRCESERMIVTGRSWLDTGQNLGGSGLAASASDVTVPVTGVFAGEVILIDAERMLVVDVAGSNAIVKRAWDGSVIATHANGADVYASRTLTVERGVLGTTAATHLTAAPLSAQVYPAPVRDLNVAEAIAQIQQEQAAYARTAGSGDNERETTAKGLAFARDAAYTTYGRKARLKAV